MIINALAKNYVVIGMIVNFGMGSKILKCAKRNGATGGTIMLAKGTAGNKVWDSLGLSEVRKEILYMVAEEEDAHHILDKICLEYKLNKPNRGIAFTTSLSCPERINELEEPVKERRGDKIMYYMITTIVEKGRAEEVIEAATEAGSKGGTIVNGRGSGIHETSKLFSMDIEPEKEMVLILAEAAQTKAITSAIQHKLQIDEPGNGIMYVQEVNETYGVYK